MATAIPERKTIPEELKWDTKALYESDEAWEKDFEAANADREKAREYTDLKDEATLLAALGEYFGMAKRLDRIMTYAMLRQDENTRDSKYYSMSDRGSQMCTAVESEWSFLQPAILALDDDMLAGCLKKPEFALYRRFLEEIIRQKPHTLDAAGEKLLSMAGNVASVPTDSYDILHDADMRFPDAEDSTGARHPVTNGNFVFLEQSEDSELRKNAFRSLYGGYRNLSRTIASLYSGIIKRDIFFAKARGYGSALEASLDGDDVSTAVYRNLIKSVRAGLPAMHRYVSLRKKMLGTDELNLWDIYMPLSSYSAAITYDEAKEKVVTGLAALGRDYGNTLREAYANNWIDVCETAGKRAGAYSTACYGTHPYVLMNWHDNTDSMFTLAHELGHSMHSYLTNNTQPYETSNYPIFLAEVASTTNEMLLMGSLLGTAKSNEEKFALLNHLLEEYKGTLIRQTMFAEFELHMHEVIENGGAITSDDICQYYLGLNRDYFGPDININDEIAYEWARIPHFFMHGTYYVYKYATGFSAAGAISRMIEKQGEEMVKKYLGFLSSGSSMKPLDALRSIGVDMETPEPVALCMQAFEDTVAKAEALC